MIADTGIGIREEDLPRIFDRGFTGFNGRLDQHSTGIGLYLCRQRGGIRHEQSTTDPQAGGDRNPQEWHRLRAVPAYDGFRGGGILRVWLYHRQSGHGARAACKICGHAAGNREGPAGDHTDSVSVLHKQLPDPAQKKGTGVIHDPWTGKETCGNHDVSGDGDDLSVFPCNRGDGSRGIWKADLCLFAAGVPAAGADGIYDEQGEFFGYGGVFCHRVSDESGCKPVAILLVAAATYFLFTSGSILALNLLKHNKSFYYRKDNYVCIAGMLYRMKKNAASLVNICIFSTMVIITLICTISLWAGEDEAIRFNNPYDCRYSFDGADREVLASFETKMGELAEQDQVRITETVDYVYGSLQEVLEENTFERYDGQAEQTDTEYVRMLPLDDYNRMQGEKESLEEGEILLYSNGKDFGYTDILFEGVPFHVKRELSNLAIDRKEEEAMADRRSVFADPDAARSQKQHRVCRRNARVGRRTSVYRRLFRTALLGMRGADHVLQTDFRRL